MMKLNILHLHVGYDVAGVISTSSSKMRRYTSKSTSGGTRGMAYRSRPSARYVAGCVGCSGSSIGRKTISISRH